VEGPRDWLVLPYIGFGEREGHEFDPRIREDFRKLLDTDVKIVREFRGVVAEMTCKTTLFSHSYLVHSLILLVELPNRNPYLLIQEVSRALLRHRDEGPIRATSQCETQTRPLL
jgi:hypothetical protein